MPLGRTDPRSRRPAPTLAALLQAAGCAALAAGVLAPAPLWAQARPSLADRFPIGSDPMVLCSAQLDRTDPAASGIFDRAYQLTCRDARLPIGRLYVLREGRGDPMARLLAARAARAECAEAQPTAVEGIAGATLRACRSREFGIDYAAYEYRGGRELFVAEGLKGYDSALQLALRTIVADHAVNGQVSVATSGGEDPAAFARAIAGTMDASSALAEAYRTNFGGQYIESAEYFGGVRERVGTTKASPQEIALNQALQQSNLGNFAAADALFAEAADAAADPILGRMQRNYLALHLLNQGRIAEAADEARRAVGGDAGLAAPAALIDAGTAGRLNSENAMVRTLSRTAPPPLTPAERVTILDAQAAHIAGAALNRLGRAAEARALLTPSLHALEQVRDGRVTSVYWLRAQMLGELASLDQQQGDLTSAEARLREAVRLVSSDLPGTNADWSARLRLAGYLAEHGSDAEALQIYQAAIHDVVNSGDTDGLRGGLAPYFRLLARKSTVDPAVVDEFFFASQTLVRLGVARSQLEFARILASGGDEAAALYRTSSQISREINARRLELARLQTARAEGGPVTAAEVELPRTIAQLEEQQTATQARLNNFTRYQVTTARPLSLAELQAVLAPDEVYYKVFFVDGQANGLVVGKDRARIVPLAIDEAGVTRAAATLRASIRKEIGDQTFIPAFDVETASALYQSLVAPAASELAGKSQLIFDPDGALLSLPLDLLITDRASADAYLARARDPDGDPYDYRGVAWLGRTLAISTTVSPRALHLVRSAHPASAPRAYLGFGQNAPAPDIRQVVVNADGAVCSLPPPAWSQPIDSRELVLAKDRLGVGSDIVTGTGFTDTAIRSRDDLDQYRILHFATHGLVTPPGKGCLPQPALLTSWGGGDSDGLLSFQEVFSLAINADVVVLSACETAAGASRETTVGLGEMTGGGFALDGLVRAFLGAGARAVIASHWPVPDKPVDATGELIGHLFAAGPGESIAQSLTMAQRQLMDRAEMSHPYYWAAFAVIGDGGQPLIHPAAAAPAPAQQTSD